MTSTHRLSPEQIQHFHDEGYVIAKSGIDSKLMKAMDDELEKWIQESRSYTSNYGETVDGKARFDLEFGHSAEHPRLRRVANPVEISESYRLVLMDSSITDMVAQLIGPSIKFHHCKLNVKLPGMETVVYYHQDHSYDPHTNDDMLAILLMLDDATEENGCLKVVPKSHKQRFSHFSNGEYTGTIDSSHYSDFNMREVPVLASRGDVCFMHTWTVHASQSNRSSTPRRILICDYTAADAYPLLSPALPSQYTGKIVRGEPSQYARLTNAELEMRTLYSEDSFFELQGQVSAK